MNLVHHVPASEPGVPRYRQARFWPYLVLMRPPNLVTALADVLAGYAAAGLPGNGSLLPLLLSTLGLYGGGVVLNDVFDAPLDAVERPERPVPSGRATRRAAGLFGAMLLFLGVGAAFVAGPISGAVAGCAAACAVLYDAWGKHQALFGPLNMGLCRGFNLMLGVSAAPALLSQRWHLALIPILYIAAITAVSRGEVHGGRRSTGRLALALLGGVALFLTALFFRSGKELWVRPLFLVFWAQRVFPPFWRAYEDPSPGTIRPAIRAGVLSLIALDAALAAVYAGVPYGIGVLLLMLPARWLARLFAVT